MLLQSKTALVFGGTGFIGANLVRTLAANGVEVTEVQRPAAGRRGTDTTFLAQSLDEQTLLAGLRGRRFDLIFNMAGYGVNPRERDPDSLMKVNTVLPKTIVAVSEQLKAQAIVMVGSGSEYNIGSCRSPIGEDHILQTEDPYGRSKAEGGVAAESAAAKTGIGFAWARLFNVYGPGEAAHRLLPSLVNGLCNHAAVPLTEGSQLRDFLHVQDVADALIALSGYLAESRKQATVNLCSGTAVSVRQFCEFTADVMGVSHRRLRFGALPMRQGEMPYFCGNPERLRKLMAWEPQLDLASGIRSSVAQLLTRADSGY